VFKLLAFVPLIIALGLLYPVSSVIRGITVEKELKQKELMKMMSVNEADIGWSWFLTFWLFHMVTAISMAAAFTGFYSQSSFAYMWLLWVLGWTAIVVFAMFLASFFSRATTATLVGLLLFFSGYFLTLAANFETGNSQAIAGISMHPIAAISYALQEIGRLEDGGVGLTRDTYKAANSESGYNVGVAYQMLIIQSFFYGALTFYFNRVIAADFGQPLPWNFLFKLSYWNPKIVVFDDGYAEGEEQVNDEVPVEQVGEGLSQSIRMGKGIEIRNLKKQFGDKTAVNNLNLSLYSNQVTALLGK
jgi:ATP-binding cassette, subfamily A (ABC1), member 3